MQRRLLIVNCSATKTDLPRTVAALDRYDGPMFRMLRRAHREGVWDAVRTDLAVVSAEFGLISALMPIPRYDRLLDEARALDLAPPASRLLRLWQRRNEYTHVALALARRYRPVLEDAVPLLIPMPAVVWITGRPGEMMARVKTWLGEGTP